MYYLKLKIEEGEGEGEGDALVYYCRNCGNEDESLVSNLNNLYVSKTDIKTTSNYKNTINKYTKLDPTLPRINNIDCPNSNCESNHTEETVSSQTNVDDSPPSKKEKEIIYVRYDDKNMKFIYLCAVCNTVWDTENK